MHQPARPTLGPRDDISLNRTSINLFIRGKLFPTLLSRRRRHKNSPVPLLLREPTLYQIVCARGSEGGSGFSIDSQKSRGRRCLITAAVSPGRGLCLPVHSSLADGQGKKVWILLVSTERCWRARVCLQRIEEGLRLFLVAWGPRTEFRSFIGLLGEEKKQRVAALDGVDNIFFQRRLEATLRRLLSNENRLFCPCRSTCLPLSAGGRSILQRIAEKCLLLLRRRLNTHSRSLSSWSSPPFRCSRSLSFTWCNLTLATLPLLLSPYIWLAASSSPSLSLALNHYQQQSGEGGFETEGRGKEDEVQERLFFFVFFFPTRCH